MNPTVTERGVPAGAALRLEPWDEHNRALVAQVRPPDWRNPEPADRYHLVVVGAGTGGLVTAAVAAGLGARVALVERHLMGGDCLNVGCVPSKALLRAARAWAAARDAHAAFGGPRASGEGDFGAVMERMRRLRAEISPVDGAARFRDLGVDVFLGEGRFTGHDALEVEGARLRFRRAVIATGSRPAVPPIRGLRAAGFHTNQTIFSLTELPERLLVIGGGPIGVELAQAFARLGSRVVLLERGERLLLQDDPEAAQLVEAALRRDGVEILTGAEVSAASADAGRRTLHFECAGENRSVSGDALLIACGRQPNVEGLGLEEAGVRHGRSGVEVDDRLRTSNRRVFAVGDVCSGMQFTHLADAQARIVVPNALFHGRGRASRLVVPWVTYTSPELAHVGITAAEARERGREIETLTLPLSEVDRARLDGEEDGFLRLHLRRGSDEILGATLVAEHAGEMISQITLAMTAGLGLDRVSGTIFPYPTQAEALRKLADRHRRRRLTPLARGVLGALLRLLR